MLYSIVSRLLKNGWVVNNVCFIFMDHIDICYSLQRQTFMKVVKHVINYSASSTSHYAYFTIHLKNMFFMLGKSYSRFW